MTMQTGASTGGALQEPAVQSTAALLQAFNQFAEVTNLVDVRLVNTRCEFHPERLADNLLLLVPPAEYRIGFDQKSGIFQCGVRLRVLIGPPRADAASAAAHIDAEYIIQYAAPPGTEVSEEVKQIFAFRIAVFNVWPFFRELVFSMSGRMNVPAILVPLFKLPLVVPPTPAPQPSTP